MKKQMKILLTSLACYVLATGLLSAQNSITGWVQDAAGNPVAYANVILLHSNDSITPIRGELTNEEGRYQFEDLPTQDYQILVYMIGYNKIHTGIFTVQSKEQLELPMVQLTEGVLLEGVEVIGEKPPYQQEMDGLRINVENSIVSAGATALGVLERSPNVTIDRQNSRIALAGKEGINVMINGKLTYMPVESLMQLLEGISADNISSIKLLTTPPAKYDAEGNGGYIDIQLKQRTEEGLNGSFSLSYGYGRGHTANNNLNLNYRKNKLNLFGNYSFVLQAQEQLFITQRKLSTETIEEKSKTIGERDPIQENHNLRLGLDYELSYKTVFGALFSAYDNKWTMDALSTNRTYLDDEFNNLLLSEREERNRWQNYSANLNLKHHLSEQEVISFDVDYLNFHNENPTEYINRSFDRESSFLGEKMIHSDKVTPLDIWVGKVDYSKQWNEKFKLEVGAKSVLSTFKNNVIVETLEGKDWIPDPLLTSNSDLTENIWAVYASADWKLNAKTDAKIGLRYESTDSELNTDTEGKVVDRRFGSFFPTLFLSHQFSESFSSNMSYSRRITRPTFNEMAPFVYFLDPNTFFAGNAALQPALTDAIQLNLNYENIFFSVQYSVQDSAIAQFQQQFDPTNNRLILASENLKNAKTWSFTLGFPLEITNWWNMRTNASYYCQENNGYIKQKFQSIQQHYFQFNTNQSFQMPLDFSSELSFFYTSPQLWGKDQLGAIYGLNAGLQKKLGKNGGSLRFNVNDVLNSNKLILSTISPQQGFSFDGDFDLSQRTFSLSYTRGFGNSKVKASRNRKTGAAEEQMRVN